MALVVLRLSIGWHFLYEGAWKIDNADKFSALPFLTLSKGPFAPIFYAMAPDLDGVERLRTEEKEVTFFTPTNRKVDVKKPGDSGFEGQEPAVVTSRELVEKKETITIYPAYFYPVEKIYDQVLQKYAPEGEQLQQFQVAWGNFIAAMNAFAKGNQEEIEGYLGSLKRFQEAKAAKNNGPEQKKRQWSEMLKLRGEAKGFLNELDALAVAFCDEIYGSLTVDQKKIAMPEFVVATDQLPYGIHLPLVGSSWTKFLDFTVTWALTLIGVCLILGFCTRLAAIGGGCFLISVLMTQPPWPTIFPPVHPEVGHALVVDKNFVEMVAIFMLATLPVGRWGGLDFFVWNWIGKPLFRYLGWYIEEDK
ncbi:MAG: hypothetical protein Q4E67_02395 [Planctomycetia bacterium]|nr:hypothetical protein [Planctomycetia bacterium]